MKTQGMQEISGEYLEDVLHSFDVVWEALLGIDEVVTEAVPVFLGMICRNPSAQGKLGREAS